jgi:hypothetical protein
LLPKVRRLKCFVAPYFLLSVQSALDFPFYKVAPAPPAASQTGAFRSHVIAFGSHS